MIPRCPDRRSRRRALAALLLLLPLALAACSNGKLVVGTLYERLDDHLRDEFEELGDFDAAQTALFEASLGTAHVWHRRSELPRYAALLDDIAASVARPGATSREAVARWSGALEARADAARACYPVNFLAPLMRSLSDAQIDGIEQHLASERAEYREEYLSRTPEERASYRRRTMEKWGKRIGVEFTANQSAMLRTALSRQVSLRRQYQELSDRWYETLFALLRDRDAPDFEPRVTAHVAAFGTLLEDAYPERWRANGEAWRDFAYRFVDAMTAEQRRAASEWMSGMADTLVAISKDEPSFVPGNDPSVGCLVDTAASDGAGGAAG